MFCLQLISNQKYFFDFRIISSNKIIFELAVLIVGVGRIGVLAVPHIENRLHVGISNC